MVYIASKDIEILNVLEGQVQVAFNKIQVIEEPSVQKMNILQGLRTMLAMIDVLKADTYVLGETKECLNFIGLLLVLSGLLTLHEYSLGE